MMEEIKKQDKEEIRETRFHNIISKVTSACYVLPEGILKANEKEQLGIYIKEPETAKLQKRLFKKVWDESTR